MLINTPIGRLGLESLFSTNEYKGNEYNGVELTFDDPAVLADMKAKVAAFVRKELKGEPPANFVWPWKKNETRVFAESGERCPGFKDGGEWIRCKRKASNPKIGPLDPVMIRNRSEQAVPRDIYPGCMGRARVSVGVYPNQGSGPGVALYLEGFQKTSDGERLGRAPTTPDGFDDGVVPADDLSI